jgi:hypothetical protein
VSLSYPKPNHNDVSNYLVGGIPFVSSSIGAPANTGEPEVVVFPQVTQRFWVDCTSGTGVRVGFSRNGVKGVEADNYYVVLAAAEPQEFRVRVGRVFLLSSDGSASTAAVTAELTPVPGDQVGGGIINNWSGSIGVG